MAPAISAASTGSIPGTSPAPPTEEHGISFREACLRLRISEKTLRKRIHKGEVDGWTVEGTRGLEWRVRLPEGTPPAPGDRDRAREGRDQSPDEDRDTEGEGRDQDRDTLHLALQEVTFLRQQLQARTTAEEQLRVMLMQLERTNAELIAALCVKALPAPETPAKTRWWARLWRPR